MGRWHTSATELLEALADSIAGFDFMISHAHHFDFYALCALRMVERKALLKRIRMAMHAQGLATDLHGTLLGAAHRLFIDLRTALQGGEKPLIVELLRGETFLADRTHEFAFHEHMPAELRNLGLELENSIAHLISDLEERLKNVESRPSIASD